MDVASIPYVARLPKLEASLYEPEQFQSNDIHQPYQSSLGLSSNAQTEQPSPFTGTMIYLRLEVETPSLGPNYSYTNRQQQQERIYIEYG